MKPASRRSKPSLKEDYKVDRGWHQIVAPAKVNLCLQVLGKRDNGYHDLLSFAGFTEFGDRLWVAVAPDDKPKDKIELSGPFADKLNAAGGDTLCAKVIEALRQADIALPPLHIKLEKNIPLGGGLGGGSTDAAALLRLIADKIVPQQISKDALFSIATVIGADVPVCLYPDWQIMTGTGTQCQPATLFLPDKDTLYAVLANPNLHVATADIFAELQGYSASALPQLEGAIKTGDVAQILSIGNDLTAPACARHPEIHALIDQLGRAHSGFIGAGMSGSGASCFALTANKSEAAQLAARLQKNGFWAQATQMRGQTPAHSQNSR